MDDFFKQTSQSLTMTEIETPVGIGLAHFVDGDKIHRNLPIRVIIHLLDCLDPSKYQYTINGESFDFSCLHSRGLSDIKAACIRFDASYMVALGYTKIMFKDCAPGDTSIVYDMWGEK